MNVVHAAPPTLAPPSLRQRVSRLLLVLALVWVVIVGVVLWAWLRHEVHELLDDGLRATGEALTIVFRETGTLPSHAAMGEEMGNPFAWQVLDAEGRVLARSREAPVEALAAPGVGFVNGTLGWRVFGSALPLGRWLLVGQLSRERLEAVFEVAGGTIASALLVALLALAWLRWRLRVYTQPLGEMGEVLARFDPLRTDARLPPPALAELAPVHEAVQTLGQRLAAHVAAEAAFNAHAAHALRTPLAGLEAQIAVALREAPQPVRERLERMRTGTARLARVVAALLALFRSGGALRSEAVDIAALLARMPLAGLTVHVHGQRSVMADADLLSAALINLLDNSLRHGASEVMIEVDAQGLEVRDNGPGVAPERLAQLQAALAAAGSSNSGAAAMDSPPGSGTGLGLLLAERVARAHGGSLQLLGVPSGFAVRLQLPPSAPRTPD